jgi:2-polyprenyl-3-methyl-5-hydroxy-6-metoxy-1,4-benzoquinol methylase
MSDSRRPPRKKERIAVSSIESGWQVVEQEPSMIGDKLPTQRQVSQYFEYARVDIAPLLPEQCWKVLEIGCGAGATLGWLKERWPHAETVGLDSNVSAISQVGSRSDSVIIHDLEEPMPGIGYFDLILALDVLEHLRDPERVLQQLVGMLSPGGSVIVSVPNLSHHSVLTPLLFKRQFRGMDEGIRDRTHLRWFTEESAIGLMVGSGLIVIDGVATGQRGRARVFDRLTFGLLRHYFTVQYIMRGQVSSAAVEFSWRQGK